MSTFFDEPNAASQSRHAGRHRIVTSVDRARVGSGFGSSEVVKLLFKENGLTGDWPWLAFALGIGTSPFRYHVAIEPGRVLVGEFLISSYEPEHARVFGTPVRRFCRLVIEPNPSRD
jgi:hypothetical protein